MNAKEVLDSCFLEMRWHCLSLAADFDRIERCQQGAEVLADDARVQSLRRAMKIILEGKQNRAEQVQLAFSDHTPPPSMENAGTHGQHLK